MAQKMYKLPPPSGKLVSFLRVYFKVFSKPNYMHPPFSLLIALSKLMHVVDIVFMVMYLIYWVKNKNNFTLRLTLFSSTPGALDLVAVRRNAELNSNGSTAYRKSKTQCILYAYLTNKTVS